MIKNLRKLTFNDNNIEPLKLNPLKVINLLSTWKGIIYKRELLEDGEFHDVEIGRNSVLAGGLQVMMEWYFDLPFKIEIESFEDSLYSTAPEDWRSKIQKTGTKRIMKAYNVVYDGVEGGQNVPYDRKKLGYTKDTLIPFRRIPLTTNNYDLYMQKYYHAVLYTHPDGTQYVDYYTKKTEISYNMLFDDNTELPDNPNDVFSNSRNSAERLLDDRDIRAISGFTLNIESNELIEYFRTEKAGEAEYSAFNGTILMAGYPAKITLNGKQYDTLTSTYVFSRCNHNSVSHGVDGSNQLIYEQLHI